MSDKKSPLKEALKAWAGVQDKEVIANVEHPTNIESDINVGGEGSEAHASATQNVEINQSTSSSR